MRKCNLEYLDSLVNRIIPSDSEILRERIHDPVKDVINKEMVKVEEMLEQCEGWSNGLVTLAFSTSTCLQEIVVRLKRLVRCVPGLE